MSGPKCKAELDAAGVPKKGMSDGSGKHATIFDLRDLVRRLRAGECVDTIAIPRKSKSAEELFCMDKAEQAAARASRGVLFSGIRVVDFFDLRAFPV